MSNLLERLACNEDKNKGQDIADYLIKFDWRKFRTLNINKETPKIQKAISINEVFETEKPIVKELPKPKEIAKESTAYITNDGKLLIPTPTSNDTFYHVPKY